MMNREDDIKFLHILPANSGRTYRFISFIKKNFDSLEHKFLLVAAQKNVITLSTKLLEFTDLIYLNNDKPKEKEKILLGYCKKSKYIIWHSLDSTVLDLNKFLYIHKELLSKSAWAEQGFDIESPISSNCGIYVRKNIAYIASIFPLNAQRINDEYGRESISVCYPLDEMLYDIANNPPTQKSCGSQAYHIIQISTDVRIYSRPITILQSLGKINLRHFRRSFIVIPDFICADGDASPVKVTSKHLQYAKKLTQCVGSISKISEKDDYIKHYTAVERMVIDPTAIIYPEYLLSPIFCGVRIYYSTEQPISSILNPAAYKCGKIGCMSIESYNKARQSKDIKELFSVFDKERILEKWTALFNIMERGSAR